MSYRADTSGNFSDKQLKGGRLVYQCTISDPAGRHFAQCSKHPHYWQQLINNYFTIVGMSIAEINNSMERDAQKIIDACPHCKEEQRIRDEYQTTRWPQGAEL